MPLAQRDDGDDELGGVAEGGVEETAPRRAGAERELLSAEADEAGERNQRRGGGDEDPRRRTGAAALRYQEIGAAMSRTLIGEAKIARTVEPVSGCT